MGGEHWHKCPMCKRHERCTKCCFYDWDDGSRTGIPTLCEPCVRQARTIRRLRALADGYKAKMRNAGQRIERLRAVIVNETKWGHEHELDGASKERARIVAASGASVWTGSLYPPEVHAAVQAICDAIERGEL